MSNIGKKPIKINEGVVVNVLDNKVVVSGPKGELSTEAPDGIKVTVEDERVLVKKVSDSTDFEKFTGLTRALIANMIEGVSKGFQKQLELSGVGYRAKVEGETLVLNVGFAVPVRVTPFPGVKIMANENIITVAGADKQLVGDTAANIRRVRPPDPYKGKGIKYVGEKIRRKVGKAAKAVGAVSK